MAENKDIVMKCRHMEKVYPGTKALDDVDFDVYRGKVNVLIGENGAGKSTLMKQIAGIEQPSSGTMYLEGEEVSFKNTTEAKAKGIGIIHQELSLFPNLNVYQNIFMNNEQKKGVVVNNAEHKKKTEEILNRLEYPIDPEALVGNLRVGQQQMIEIARNLIQDDLKILIMDEPTSSLSQSEVQVLFKIMRELNAQGISISEERKGYRLGETGDRSGSEGSLSSEAGRRLAARPCQLQSETGRDPRHLRPDGSRTYGDLRMSHGPSSGAYRRSVPGGQEAEYQKHFQTDRERIRSGAGGPAGGRSRADTGY